MNPLFPLIWANEAEALSTAAALSDRHWIEVTRLAAQHRLRPLLHHRGAALGWSPPARVTREWRNSSQRAGLRALRQRAELQRIGRAFAADGLAAITLKGGALVWNCCPEPALRPLRDLDLLVARDDAEKAARILAANGFAQLASTMPEDAKHLAPMVRGSVAVELHLHLLESPDPASQRREAEFMAHIWQRAVPSQVAPGLLEPSPTDTLLHLILHAVLDHQFNNGPLLIADMLWLTGSERIDWTVFWREAEALEVVRACQLALGTGEAIGCLKVDWNDHKPTDLAASDIERVTRLMLVEVDQRSAVGWPGKLARLPFGRWPRELKQMFRRRHERGTTAGPAEPGSAWATDLKRILSRDGRTNAADAVGLGRWLRKDL